MTISEIIGCPDVLEAVVLTAIASFITGWFIGNFMGFWEGIKLFKPDPRNHDGREHNEIPERANG